MREGDAINVTRVIDEGAVSQFQILAIVLCGLVAFLDGVDSQSIAVAAPIIADNLKLARSALGPIFSSSLLGAAIGALTFGPLGDRFGRKTMLAIAAAIFGVFTLATPLCNSYEPLLAVRFAAGIGLGGATPCFIALASEYSPARRRAMVASLIWSAFPLGGTIGGFANSYILSHHGWQAIFWVGGVLPILVVIALMIALPESLRFLIASGTNSARIAAIARKLRPDLPATTNYVSDEEQIQGAPVRQLFAEGRAARTILLWVPFFTAFGTLALTVVWTPLLLRDNGISPAQASIVLGVHGIGALIGMGSAGRLMERFGVAVILFPSLVLGAVATGTLGYAATSVGTMSAALFFVGLFVGMGASGSIALAALTYPTAIRSSGIGWAMGMGRFGQVLAPLFAGAVIAAGWTGSQLFVAVALAPVLGALAIIMMRAEQGGAKVAVGPTPSPSAS
ncbi:MAG: MFS transporter [Methylobacteriaceae bacterium]|nr:MFS transporter [Methylobacteriaceae bacterium]